MKRGPCWLFALLPLMVYADDNRVTDLLARIRHSGEAQFRYQETRALELATAPWHGEGYMLSGADGSLVKLQLQPKRVLMAIAHQRMYYWDPEQKQRHSAPLGSGGPAAEQIVVFGAILQGHAEELRADYDFAAETHGQHWILRVTPKPLRNQEDAASIEISGDEEDNSQRRILIRQADGDSTEYQMLKVPSNRESAYSISGLLREVIGD